VSEGNTKTGSPFPPAGSKYSVFTSVVPALTTAKINLLEIMHSKRQFLSAPQLKSLEKPRLLEGRRSSGRGLEIEIYMGYPEKPM